MLAEDAEATTNNKAGADTSSLASVSTLGSGITDNVRATPKEIPLADLATPDKGITAGVVAANAPKGKAAAGADEVTYFSSS